MTDYVKFCVKCGWNDPDQGCSVNPLEVIYQCPMYMYYHPKEVKEWENTMNEAWLSKQKRRK